MGPNASRPIRRPIVASSSDNVPSFQCVSWKGGASPTPSRLRSSSQPPQRGANEPVGTGLNREYAAVVRGVDDGDAAVILVDETQRQRLHRLRRRHMNRSDVGKARRPRGEERKGDQRGRADEQRARHARVSRLSSQLGLAHCGFSLSFEVRRPRPDWLAGRWPRRRRRACRWFPKPTSSRAPPPRRRAPG